MPNISNLVEDIYTLLDKPNKDFEFDDERDAHLGGRLVRHIRDEIRDPDRDRPADEVYVTQFTHPCARRIWYNLTDGDPVFGAPKERINGSNKFKFLYGDLIEESVLYLAECAGHAVEMQQERLSLSIGGKTLIGRIDGMVDGVLIDVKSMDTWSFGRLQAGTYEDKFGYYKQLGIYKYMLEVGRSIAVPDAGILAVNKQNGRILYHEVDPSEMSTAPAVVYDALTNPDVYFEAPEREVTSKGGNKALGARCAYCPFKFQCYEEEGGLTVYAYSEGPTFIIGKHKTPKVPDITEAYKKETGLAV